MTKKYAAELDTKVNVFCAEAGTKKTLFSQVGVGIKGFHIITRKNQTPGIHFPDYFSNFF